MMIHQVKGLIFVQMRGTSSKFFDIFYKLIISTIDNKSILTVPKPQIKNSHLVRYLINLDVSPFLFYVDPFLSNNILFLGEENLKKLWDERIRNILLGIFLEIVLATHVFDSRDSYYLWRRISYHHQKKCQKRILYREGQKLAKVLEASA